MKDLIYPKQLKENDQITINQLAHGFVVGDYLIYDKTTSAWKKANVTGNYAIGSIGRVVDVESANSFEIKVFGIIVDYTGLTAGEFYYAKDDGSGGLTVTPPTSVIQAVLFALPGNKAVELRYPAVTPSNVVPTAELYLQIVDEKSPGVDGGTFTAGSYLTRDLNAVKTNQIVGASLASNQITLPAGTYRIFATAPFYSAGHAKAILYNITDSMIEIIGSAEFVSGTTGSTSRNLIAGEFTIASPKVYEIQHQCDSTAPTVGFGAASNFTENEIYTIVEIWKVA